MDKTDTPQPTAYQLAGHEIKTAHSRKQALRYVRAFVDGFEHGAEVEVEFKRNNKPSRMEFWSKRGLIAWYAVPEKEISDENHA